MPQKCTICMHPDRGEIDLRIVSGEANRRIASHWDISEASVRRHTAAHIPDSLWRASEAGESGREVDLLSRLENLYSEAAGDADALRTTGDYRGATAGIRERVRIIEVMSKLTTVSELSERIERLEEVVQDARL